MDVTIHNPERTDCQVLRASGDAFANIDFKCRHGGTVSMFFESPDEIRNHAVAMMLLAERLEEEQ